MANVSFKNYFGEIATMELATEVRSIFDRQKAGSIATNGEYYVICVDNITRERYAVTREVWHNALALGHPLSEGEQAIFNGEKVRGMTFREERLWDADMLNADVDLWGNVRIEREEE